MRHMCINNFFSDDGSRLFSNNIVYHFIFQLSGNANKCHKNCSSNYYCSKIFAYLLKYTCDGFFCEFEAIFELGNFRYCSSLILHFKRRRSSSFPCMYLWLGVNDARFYEWNSPLLPPRNEILCMYRNARFVIVVSQMIGVVCVHWMSKQCSLSTW